jgi:tetratricopeptide (TPR) repeat protein
MAQRYEVIKKIDTKYLAVGSPILLSAHALVKDTVRDTVNAQCKFTNLGKGRISAVYISIACIGADGTSVMGVDEYVYLDLTAQTGANFGDDKLIPLPDKTTRAYTIALNKIVFADGSLFQQQSAATFIEVPEPRRLSELGHLEIQYRADNPKRQANMPEERNGYWICACGQVNVESESPCVNCQSTLRDNMQATNTTTLEAHVADAKQREETARIEAQERAERERIEAAERAVIAEANQKKQKRLAIIMGSAAVVIIAIVFIVIKVIIPASKYSAAEQLLEHGNYDEAIAAFSALGDFKDSTERIAEADNLISEEEYQAAEQLLASGDYTEAIAAFSALGDYKDSTERITEAENLIIGEECQALKQQLSTAIIGSIVKYGEYEWRVLDKTNNKLLIIANDIVKYLAYNSEYVSITWEQCTLREYLNGEFYSKFTEAEKALIADTKVVNADNSKYGTSGGNDTTDKIFLLSIDEANKYFKDDSERALDRWWWLRSPGTSIYDAALVSSGTISVFGSSVNGGGGVRPAMWLDLGA